MEATGRENIMYRGLLLGENPKVIKDKTDEIIEFTELGDFINYPIKSYSSGMIVRLAFAISTMIEGDILLLDEIFGAGDARFMHKAKERIKNLVRAANILVFVSHDLSAIQELCNRAIWLEQGKVKLDGEITSVIDRYKEEYAG
jgi:lipopolysaccharide transport system ATP-binding protein